MSAGRLSMVGENGVIDAAGTGGNGTSARGDQRREALLRALDDQLRVRKLDDISVADLTDAAGITRSAFYFYFESKAAAVTVLLASVQEQAENSTDLLVGEEGVFRDRISAALERLADRVVENAHIYRALLTARTTHEPTRAMWDGGRTLLAEPIADRIRTEREAGRAPDGPEPQALAEALVRINESVLECLAHTPEAPRDPLLTTAADMWVRSIYGRPDAAVDPASVSDSATPAAGTAS